MSAELKAICEKCHPRDYYDNLDLNHEPETMIRLDVPIGSHGRNTHKCAKCGHEGNIMEGPGGLKLVHLPRYT